MRKLWTLFLSSSLFALPIGNTAISSTIDKESFVSFDAGFYGSYVYNRHMFIPDGGNTIQDFRLNTNAGIIAFNFWNRYNVFATLGASNISFDTNGDKLRPRNYDLKGQQTNLLSSDGFSWSVGGNGTLLTLMKRYAWGFEYQYFRTKPKLDYMVFEQSHTTNLSGRTVTYSEWQVGSALVYYLNGMVFPYAGLSWSRATADFGVGRIIFADNSSYDIGNMRNERPWAYSVGTTISFYEQLNCTVEGRFAGELGLSLNGTYTF